MCCGQISPKAQRRAAQAQQTQVQQPTTTVAPSEINIVNDNLNSQRAAIVNSQKHHRRYFGRTG